MWNSVSTKVGVSAWCAHDVLLNQIAPADNNNVLYAARLMLEGSLPTLTAYCACLLQDRDSRVQQR